MTFPGFRSPTRGLAVLLACMVLINLLAVIGMRHATGLPIIAAASTQSLQAQTAYYPMLSVESDRAYFRQELADLVEREPTTEAKVLSVLSWVMNQFSRVENSQDESSHDMVLRGQTGGGTLCGGMAQVFRDALLAVDIPARTISFQRNPFDTLDTHMSVEAWVDGKWRMFDPTFHIALRVGGQDGEYVGVLEAREWYLMGRGQPVEIVFLGEVAYPARLENNPLRYSAYFDNVYVNLRGQSSLIDTLPVVRRLHRWTLVYPEDERGLSHKAQNFYRALFTIVVLVLPMINLVLMGLLLLVGRRGRPIPLVKRGTSARA